MLKRTHAHKKRIKFPFRFNARSPRFIWCGGQRTCIYQIYALSNRIVHFQYSRAFKIIFQRETSFQIELICCKWSKVLYITNYYYRWNFSVILSIVNSDGMAIENVQYCYLLKIRYIFSVFFILSLCLYLYFSCNFLRKKVLISSCHSFSYSFYYVLATAICTKTNERNLVIKSYFRLNGIIITINPD